MKIRTAFVSNSSSASFTVSKDKLSYIEQCSLLNYTNPEGESWYIRDEGDTIKGSTHMDNGDMEEFLQKVGINKIIFDDGWGY